jgi:myo-inositol-1(or 4)-monophosphatase
VSQKEVSSNPTQRIGAVTVDQLPLKELLLASEAAAKRGAEVVMAAVDKPRNIDYKGKTDLVTDTDRNTELAILEVLRDKFPGHLVLGEEGGVSGDATSEYLWCIDPLDGTTNFAHGYPSFAVSVAVLHRGRPVAASVVEFAGGPFAWVTRTFTASAGNCSPLVSPSSLCQPFQVPLCSFLGPYEEDLFLE